MFTTDSLFFLALFVIPGAIKIIYDAHITLHPYKESDEKLRMAKAILFAFIIFAVCAIVFEEPYNNFINQESVFDPMSRLFKISVANIVFAFVGCLVWDGLHAFYRVVRNESANNREESTFEPEHTAREFAFSDRMMGTGPQVVKIVSDGIVTVGSLDFYTEGHGGSPNLTLTCCREFEEFINGEAELPPEERCFDDEKYTYVDVENGYKVIFYDMTKYLSYIQQQRASGLVEGESVPEVSAAPCLPLV